MEQVKIGVDEAKLNDCEIVINKYHELFNVMFMQYKTLGLRDLKPGDLDRVLTGEAFIKDVLLENSELEAVGKVKLSKTKLRELVEMPSNTQSFVRSVNELVEYNKDVRGLPVFLNDFEIKGGKIVFPDWQKIINTRCAVFINGAERIEFFEVVNKICDILNACKHPHTFIGGDRCLFAGVNRHIIVRNGEYVVNVEVLRRV
jgi:hypothetical protein